MSQLILRRLNNVVDNDASKKQYMTNLDASNSSKLVKKLNMTQKVKKFKIKFLIMINILLLLKKGKF